ncbi:MAG: bactofilin family protein [Nitritalea sp.]
MFTSNKQEDKKATTQLVTSSNVISKETTIVGNITSQGNIRIEGNFEGRLESKSKIVLGDSARVKGEIFASELEIAGKVEGMVTCYGLLLLQKSAHISGDIITEKLVVENGAHFDGKCQMGSAPKQSAARVVEKHDRATVA